MKRWSALVIKVGVAYVGGHILRCLKELACTIFKWLWIISVNMDVVGLECDYDYHKQRKLCGRKLSQVLWIFYKAQNFSLLIL